MIHAMLAVNLTERCNRLLAGFYKLQHISGYFKSQEGEWDSNGQVLWILDRYQKLTGTDVNRMQLEAVLKGAEWIRRKRRSTGRGQPHSGLLPAGFSAEHFGPNDYYYWDDFWSIAGLFGAARLAGEFGSVRKQAQLSEAARDFEKTVFDNIAAIPEHRKKGGIPASPYRRMDAGAVGVLVADYPLQLTPPGDARILATIEYLLGNCFHAGGFFQDMVHSGVNAYLTLAIAQSLLRSRDKRFRSLVTSVADMATPTGQWPEAIHPATGGGCMGDGQHGWAAAEWVMMIRNMFVAEDDGALTVGAGLFPAWLQENTHLGFGPTPTPSGTLGVRIEVGKRHCRVELDIGARNTAPVVHLELPGFEQKTIQRLDRPVRIELEAVT
jgi:GH15 family glucan-1,4-alpha-glucosidase